MMIWISGPRGRHLSAARTRIVDTTSQSREIWSRALSPFFLKPIDHAAHLVENAWQFSKVYADQLDAAGNPSDAYWQWARRGWSSTWAVRYPRGKGAAPAFALWRGQRLGYLEARRLAYFPLYRDAVRRSATYQRLVDLVSRQPVVLWDFDGYDHEARGMSLADVLLNPAAPMGHAFVLKAMLMYGDDVTPEQLLAIARPMAVEQLRLPL